MSAEPEYDFVIAGAGAGGGFAAMVLAERGFKVLLLERGKRFDRSRDFPMNHPDWELKARAFSRNSSVLDRSATAPISPADHDICSARFNDKGVLLPNPAKRRGGLGYHRAIGVGGSTLHYQGEAHRYPAHAFAPRSLYGWGEDWPLSYEQLAPYYAKAEKILGVAGEVNNPFKPPRGAFPTPAHDLSTRSQLAKRGAQALGWSLLPNTLALPSESVDGRSACQHSGGCVQGCIFGAKSSTDLTAISRAEKSGNLTLLEKARLLEILTDAEGNVAGFIYKRGKETKKAIASTYILALGAIETPRMMLASQSTAHPNGLGNNHDQVGRNFMETVMLSLQCIADQPLHSYKGPPLDARIWDFSQPQPPLRSGFVLGVAGTLSGRHGPLSYAGSIAGMGLAHKNRMRAQFGRDIQLFGIADHVADPRNRLTLSNNLDRDGVPRVNVMSDYGEIDRRTLREMKARLLQWADACGLSRRQSLRSSYDSPLATHVGGTCRMGSRPESSVTDEKAGVHGIRNLYITDASLLPTLGAGDSPSLTIQALAMRSANGMKLSGK